MKKVMSVLLVLSILLSTTAYAKSNDPLTNTLLLAREDTMLDINTLAKNYLLDTKHYTKPSSLGYTDEEFYGLSLGTPFSIYTYDDVLCDFVSNTFSFPLLYDENIIGVLELYCEENSQIVYYKLGKAYADQLNSLRYEQTIDKRNPIAIVNIGNCLFATTGADVYSLRDATFNENKIQNVHLLEDIITATEKQSNNVLMPTYSPISSDRSLSNSGVSPLSINDKVIDMDLMQQIGNQICGIVSFAEILNFRFSSSYTYNSLYSAMSNSYMNGNDGIPAMNDYKNFANNIFDANCVLRTSLTFTTLKNKINADIPIMGCWLDDSGTTNENDDGYHSINIIGFRERNTSFYYYYIHNPWYSDYEQITVASYNTVVYTDSGHTFELTHVLY